MKHKIICVAVLALSATFFVSCGSGGSDQKDTVESFDEETDSEKSISSDETVRTRTVVFPSATEIMSVFKNAGLKFKPGVTADINSKSNFDTRFQKAIGAGIYTSGLAYHVIHNQSAQAPEYLKAVLELTADMGISGVSTDDELVTRFEQSLGDEDEMLNIISDVQAKTDASIDENDMQDWAMLIFSAAWLEGMYIGVEANDNFSKGDLSRRIAEQMGILDNQIRVLEDTELQGEEFSDFLSELKLLNDYYLDLPEVQESEGIPKLGLNQLKNISDQIKDLRNSLM